MTLASLFLLLAGVLTAPKGELYDDDVVVTNVNLTAADVHAIPSTAGHHQLPPGSTIDFVGQTTGSGVVGGPRVVNSSVSPDDNYTAYLYNGVAVHRSSGTEDFLYDSASSNGIVRRKELASIDMSSKQDRLPYPTNAIPYSALALIGIGVPEFSAESKYLTGEVVQHNGVLYRSLYHVSTPTEFYDDMWEPVTNLQQVFSGSLKQLYLPLGNGGSATPQGFMVRIGSKSTGGGGATYLHGDNDYLKGSLGVYTPKDGGQGVYLHTEGYIQVVRNGTLWNQYDLSTLIDINRILPISPSTIAYEAAATSPRYVYQYLTNLYYEAEYVDDNFLRKSDAQTTYLSQADAQTTYLSQADAQTTYASKSGVSDQIQRAFESQLYIYDSYGQYRLGYDGTIERHRYSPASGAFSQVAFTNRDTGVVLEPSGTDAWTGVFPTFGTLEFFRTNDYIVCRSLPISAHEDYPGDVVLDFSGPGIGTFVAVSRGGHMGFGWETVRHFADTADVAAKQDALPYPTNAIPYSAVSGTPNPGQVATNVVDIKAGTITSNVVTKAYVESLGIKGGGAEVEDPVRDCTWVQCCTNGVFYWIVKEE